MAQLYDVLAVRNAFRRSVSVAVHGCIGAGQKFSDVSRVPGDNLDSPHRRDSSGILPGGDPDHAIG